VAVEISSFTLVVRGIDLEDEPDILGVHTIGLEEPDMRLTTFTLWLLLVLLPSAFVDELLGS
jgi:hypothetical protein